MIFEAAGRLGIDPRPFTWRQLDWMDTANRREEWKQTGDVCHTIAQGNTKQKLPHDMFDRFAQATKPRRGPVRKVKPSELLNIA